MSFDSFLVHLLSWKVLQRLTKHELQKHTTRFWKIDSSNSGTRGCGAGPSRVGSGIENQLQLQNQILKVRNQILVKLKCIFHLSFLVHIFFFRWWKGAVKNVFVFESLIQEIYSKALIHPVMSRINLESLNHSIHKFHEILFSCPIFSLKNCKRTTTSIKNVFLKSQFIQNQAAVFWTSST